MRGIESRSSSHALFVTPLFVGSCLLSALHHELKSPALLVFLRTLRFTFSGLPAFGWTMTIVYALIARGKAVLAEFTATAGNFPTVTRVLLNKIPPEDTRMSYVSWFPLPILLLKYGV